jgi:16S rRNA (uracil1498-N3)-methyltransferase
MKQLVLPGVYPGPARITLGPSDSRYLLRVLRMGAGDELPAVDAAGGRYSLRILRAERGACEVSVQPLAAGGHLDGSTAAGAPGTAAPAGTPVPSAASTAARITLLQCLPKGRKLDLIVRQATEAGVARIIPLVSAHTIVRVGEDDRRTDRLRRIAREAVQQSGAPRLPVIEEPRALATLPGEDWGTALLFHEQDVADHPLHRALAGRPSAVSVLIGPEGGLDGKEVALLTAAGFLLVHLDTGVLRVETAATFALGAVMTILQERNEWKPVSG